MDADAIKHFEKNGKESDSPKEENRVVLEKGTSKQSGLEAVSEKKSKEETGRSGQSSSRKEPKSKANNASITSASKLRESAYSKLRSTLQTSAGSSTDRAKTIDNVSSKTQDSSLKKTSKGNSKRPQNNSCFGVSATMDARTQQTESRIQAQCLPSLTPLHHFYYIQK